MTTITSGEAFKAYEAVRQRLPAAKPVPHRYRQAESLEELAGAPFIADDREGLILPRLEASGLPRLRNGVLRCDDPMAQIAHLQAGLGVGICQVKLAQRLGLTRVLPDLAYLMPAWLVVHEDQARLKRIRHVFDALKKALPALM